VVAITMDRRKMPRARVQPSLPRAAGRKPQPVRPLRSVKRIPRQQLIERRDVCITRIARLRGEGVAGDLHDKACRLLTQHWSVAPWRARADILRTAEWLIGIEAAGADHNAGASRIGESVR
jgi:hypothetical protein